MNNHTDEQFLTLSLANCEMRFRATLGFAIPIFCPEGYLILMPSWHYLQLSTTELLLDNIGIPRLA